MKQKVMRVISMGVNFVIFIMALIAWIVMMVGDGSTTLSATGMGTLRYFTILSNLFVGLCSLLMGIFQLVGLVRKEVSTREWMLVLKHASVTGITITFLVVLFFLAPRADQGYWSMFMGSNLFFHLIIPVLTILNFLFLENEPRLQFKYTPFSIFPVLIYGIFYILNYEFHFTSSEGNYDWYGFIGDGSSTRIILLVALFIIGTYLIGLILFFINHLLQHAIRGYDDDEGEEIIVEKDEKAVQEFNENKTATHEVILNDKVIAHVDQCHIPEGKQVEEIKVEGETKQVRETYSTETGTIHVVTKKVKNKKTRTNMSMTGTNRYKDGVRTYHISKHAFSGNWQVKLANGEKAIKTFPTQKEAIDYAKSLVKTQGGSIRIHSKKGSIRKD